MGPAAASAGGKGGTGSLGPGLLKCLFERDCLAAVRALAAAALPALALPGVVPDMTAREEEKHDGSRHH